MWGMPGVQEPPEGIHSIQGERSNDLSSIAAQRELCERPNRCKKLTTRRLLARRPSGRLSQSALRGGALSAKPFSSRRTKRAAVCVASDAALQLMRQSLGRLRCLIRMIYLFALALIASSL